MQGMGIQGGKVEDELKGMKNALQQRVHEFENAKSQHQI